MAFDSLAVGGMSVYYLARHNEFGRVKGLRITLDLAVNVFGRALLTGVVADAVSRRMFVNYLALKQHKMADNEVKKVMRMMPDAKPHLAPHKKPNSYFWC